MHRALALGGFNNILNVVEEAFPLSPLTHGRDQSGSQRFSLARLSVGGQFSRFLHSTQLRVLYGK